MPHWPTLLTRVTANLDELAEQFVFRVREIPSYSNGAVPDEELRTTAHTSIKLVLAALEDDSQHPALERYAVDLGERRALQGLSSRDLTDAVRLNFPVIWPQLVEHCDKEHLPELISRAELVWSVLDNYATACYDSFHRVRLREARHEANLRKRYIRALFTAEARVPAVQQRFAAVFAAPLHENYAVFSVVGQSSRQMQQLERSANYFLYEAESHSYLFWPFARQTLDYELPSELHEHAGALVVSFSGISGIPEAARLAATLADQLEAGEHRILTLDQDWTRLARNLLSERGVDFGSDIELALQQCKADEAARIRETVTTYIRTGSITTTAKELFTHRNTVLNRLKKFSDLTGLDLRIPEASARVAIAWG